MRTWRRFAVVAWAVGARWGSAPVARAQVMSTVVAEADRAGFGFYDLSVFGAYINARTPALSPTGSFLADYSFHNYSSGVSASLGWRSSSAKKWRLNLIFTPAYFYTISSTGFSRSRLLPRQGLSLDWGLPLSARWTLSTNLSVTGGDYNQLLLQSNPDQLLAGAAGAAGQLATAVLSNAVSGAPQSVLTGEQSLLYGGAFLMGTGTVSLSYDATQRLTFSESTSASRTQGLGNADGGPPQASLINQSTTLNETLSASYRLAERTRLFGTVGYSRAISSLYVTPWTSVDGGVGRSVTEHLFVNGSVGAGYRLPSGQGPARTGFQRVGWQASLSAAYRFYRQSLVASASRTVADNYGLGASGTIYARLGWHFSPLGSPWGLSVGATEIRFQGAPFGGQGYHVNAGVTRILTGRVFASLSYGYGAGRGIVSLTDPVVAHTHTQSVSLNFGFHPYLGRPDSQGFQGTEVGP